MYVATCTGGGVCACACVYTYVCMWLHIWDVDVRFERVRCIRVTYTYIGLARTIYIRCIYGIFGREITKYTVIYGVYIRFWPTLHIYIHTYTRARAVTDGLLAELVAVALPFVINARSYTQYMRAHTQARAATEGLPAVLAALALPWPSP